MCTVAEWLVVDLNFDFILDLCYLAGIRGIQWSETILQTKSGL